MKSLQTGHEDEMSALVPSLHDLNLDEQIFYSMRFDMGPSMNCETCPWVPLSNFLFHHSSSIPSSIQKPITSLPRLCPFRKRKCEGATTISKPTIPYSRGQLFRLFWDTSGIFVTRNTDIGPTYLLHIDLDFLNVATDEIETFFTRQGIFYSVITGQNDETPHSLYGPLPVASTPSHLAFVYLFETTDEKLKDLRSLGQTYVIIAFLFAKELEEYLPRRKILQETFKDIFNPINTVDLLDTRLLVKLKTRLLLCTICVNFPFYRLE